MRMLRWMRGVTKKDKIRKEHARESVKVAPVTKKFTDKTMKWYVNRRKEGDVLRRLLDAPISGKIRRGRQKTWRKDFCK